MRLMNVLLLGLMLAGCRSWEQDVTRHDIAFERYAKTGDGHVGVLADTTTVSGVACAGGEWAHFNADWSIMGCMLAEPLTLCFSTLPAGSWVWFRQDRLVVALPEDGPCGEGWTCRGTGGPKGVQTVYYTNGRLNVFFPAEDVVVSGAACRATPSEPVRLTPEGELESCARAE